MDTHWSIRTFFKGRARGLRHTGSVALRAFAVAAMLLLLLGPLPPHPVSNTPGALAKDLEWSTVGMTAGAADANIGTHANVLFPTDAAQVIGIAAVGRATHNPIATCPDNTVFAFGDAAGATNFEVFRSTSNGGTWEKVATNAGGGRVNAAACSPNYSSDGTVVVMQSTRILAISNNRGVNWTADANGAYAGAGIPTSLSLSNDFNASGTVVGTVVVGNVAATPGAAAVTIIDGRIDVNGSGAIDAADDLAAGVIAAVTSPAVIAGTLDVNGDGVIDGLDDYGGQGAGTTGGTICGRNVNNGFLDVDADGAITAADDATVGADLCGTGDAIIDGQIDVDGGGTITGADVLAAGVIAVRTAPAVIDGGVDVNDSGVVGAEDDYGSQAAVTAGGTICARNVNDGALDTNADGAITVADDDASGLCGAVGSANGQSLGFLKTLLTATTFSAATALNTLRVDGANLVEAADDFGVCRASPKYSDDGATQCLVSTAAGNNGAAFTGGARFIGTAAATLSLTDLLFGEKATEGDIALSSDYNAAISNNPRYVVAVNSGTGGNDGLWTRSSGGFINRLNVALSNVVMMGDMTTGQVVVGYYALSNVRYSSNGGVSFDDVRTMIPANAGATPVALAPNGTVYSVTHNLGANGNIGGVYVSSDALGTITGSSLTESVHRNAPLAWDVSGGRIFLLTQEAGNGSEALWYTSAPSESGTAWWRVNRSSSTTNALITDDPRDVQIAPGTPGTVYLLTSGTVDQLRKSTSLTTPVFTATTKDPGFDAITSMRVKDANIVYAGDVNGYVWRTTDGGATWTKGLTDLGSNVNSIAVDPDAKLWASATANSGNLEVFTSADGATWTQYGSSLTTDNWGGGGDHMNFAAPAWTATSKLVYMAPNGAGDDIFRTDTLATTPMWTPLLSPNLAQGYNGLAVGTSGILYAGVRPAVGADAHVSRTFDAATLSQSTINDGTALWSNTRPDLAQNTNGDNLGLGGLAASTVRMNSIRVMAGSDVLYALETGEPDPIRTWTNTTAYLAGPSVTSPVNNGTIASNSGRNGVPGQILFNSVAGSAGYHVQVALGSDFKSVLCQNDPAAGNAQTCGMPNGRLVATVGTVAVNNLIDGQSYWARVRSTHVLIGGVVLRHDGPWGATVKFSVGSAGAPTAPTPSLPLEGQTLSGLGTGLSWNNPAGTAQVHVEVMPLNLDGPGIGLIRSDPAALSGSFTVSAPDMTAGTNYVMLPGSTYTWRVRSSNSTGSIGVTDPSWGPWSAVRTFMTRAPSSASITLKAPASGSTTTDRTPTLEWTDGANDVFYYEVQLSADPRFGDGGPVASVYHNLTHGGVTTPKNSWTVPDSAAVTPGTYYYRVRPRLQATPLGAEEPGVAWTAARSFMVQ